MSSNQMETHDVTLLHETDSAILVENDCGEEIWLPKSQIDFNDEGAEAGALIEIDVPRWLAEEKGL